VKEYVEVQGRRGVVKFKQGTVVFSGERHDAVARILELGADPKRLAFQVSPEGTNGIADAPDWGIARSKHGIARAGANGFAEAGSFGTALVNDLGYARAGDFGLASVYERGKAIAGFA
jgi:hypothetical protein